MARRRVTGTGHYRNGGINTLCGTSWSATKLHVIGHIERGRHAYHVQDSYGRTADVRVVKGPKGTSLRIDPDSSCSDNLDALPGS